MVDFSSLTKVVSGTANFTTPIVSFIQTAISKFVEVIVNIFGPAADAVLIAIGLIAAWQFIKAGVSTGKSVIIVTVLLYLLLRIGGI